jgi:hypothetical protein
MLNAIAALKPLAPPAGAEFSLGAFIIATITGVLVGLG